MALFQFNWLRRVVRRNTRPIQYNKAIYWKEKLSIVYMLVAWNAFGFVCYMIYTGKKDWAQFHGIKSEEDLKLSPARQFAKQLNIDKARVITISGFKKTGEYEILNNNAEESTEETQQK